MNRKALLAVLVLVLLGGMVVSVFLGNFDWANGQSSDSNGDPNTWSMFHGDLAHTGYSTSTAPLTNQTLWNYQQLTLGFGSSSPAVADGIVYIGSGVVSGGNLLAFGPMAAPITSARPNVLEQGQFSTLSFPAVNSGSPPYTYQWFSEAPPNPAWSAAAPYTLISDATYTSYLFGTSNFTALGIWSFMVQVTDSAGGSVNSTVATVIVNSVLAASSVSASPSTMAPGQSSTLTSFAVTTGTSPYTYQWFSEAPDASSYSPISGATKANYTFATQTSTATGNWSFILQVADNMDASVNSSAATVTVNTPTTTPVSTATATPSPTQSPATTALIVGVVVVVVAVGVAIFVLLKKRQKLLPIARAVALEVFMKSFYVMFPLVS